jgi:nitrogen PTS system EIIA component
MDLTIEEVADLLKVSQTAVEKWLEDKKIPSYQIKGEHRFSRSEIEAWMMNQNAVQDSFLSQEKKMPLQGDEMKRVLHSVGMQKYCLYRAIHRGLVIKDIKATDKQEVICQATKQIADHLNLDHEVITELLLDREKMMPTALNHGIGVPHTRDFLLSQPFDVVSVVFLEKPIDYGALDGKPVDILFFIFSCGDKRHLQILAKIAHIASSEKAREFLRSSPSKESLLDFVKDWEEDHSA